MTDNIRVVVADPQKSNRSRRTNLLKRLSHRASVCWIDLSGDKLFTQEKGAVVDYDGSRSFDLLFIHCGDNHLREAVDAKHEIGYSGTAGYDDRCHDFPSEMSQQVGRLGRSDQIFRSVGKLSGNEVNGILGYVEALLKKEEAPKPDLLLPPRSYQLLPALAILCQGYLAVHARQSENDWGPKEIEPALGQMGYTSEVHKRLQANVEAKKSAVTDPEWWVLPETNNGDLMRRAQKEWDPSDDDRGWEKFRMLLNRINENNSPLDTARDRKLVATAYCALADRLGGIPCG